MIFEARKYKLMFITLLLFGLVINPIFGLSSDNNAQEDVDTNLEESEITNEADLSLIEELTEPVEPLQQVVDTKEMAKFQSLRVADATVPTDFGTQFITNVKIIDEGENEISETNFIDYWHVLRFEYEFDATNETLKTNDTMTIGFANNEFIMRSTEKMTFVLYVDENEDGKIDATEKTKFADAVVDANNNNVVITFTDYVVNKANIKGLFNFEAELNRKKYPIGNSFEYTVHGKNVITINTEIGGEELYKEELLYKWGFYDTEKNLIGWTMRVNFKATTLGNTIQKIDIRDLLGPALKIKDNEVIIYEVTFDDNYNEVLYTKRLDLMNQVVLDADGKGFTVTLNNVDKTYYIEYYTEVTNVELEVVSNEYSATISGQAPIFKFQEYVRVNGGGLGKGDTDSKFVIYKVDEQGNEIKGAATDSPAKFDLYQYNGNYPDPNNQLIKSGLEATNGILNYKGPLNTEQYYYLIETEAPTGYVIDTAPIQFYYEGEVVVRQKQNKLQTDPSLEITKVSQNDSSVLLAGAQFKLKDSKGNFVNNGNLDYWETGVNGKITIPNLPLDVYTLIETKAPEGYKMGDDPEITISITDKNTPVIKKTITNEKNGIVELTKVDRDTRDKLEGARFYLKKDNVYLTEPSSTVKKEFVTNNLGVIRVENLQVGNYEFEEIEAPNGYVLASNQDLRFKITEAQTTSAKLTVENVAKKQGVLLEKTASVTNEVLQGAQFNLLFNGVTLKNPDNTDKVYTTNSDGQIVISALDVGSYEFIEISAPSGYKLTPNQNLTFTIDVNQTKFKEVKVENERILGLKIVKLKKGTLNGLQGAKFQLLDLSKNPITVDSKDEFETDQNGEIILSDLPAGTYILKETKAPIGYQINATAEQQVTISKTQTQFALVTVENKLLPGGVVLTKVDRETNEKLTGAIFELRSSSGQLIKEGLLTDSAGTILIEKLLPGDYQFVETMAPLGYKKDGNPIKFTIEENQQKIIELTKSNDVILGNIELTKVDAKTKLVLKDAIFRLEDLKGNIIAANLKTNEAGKIEINNIRPGDYQFVEMAAPIGYQLNTNPILVTVPLNPNATIPVKLVVENSEVPITPSPTPSPNPEPEPSPTPSPNPEPEPSPTPSPNPEPAPPPVSILPTPSDVEDEYGEGGMGNGNEGRYSADFATYEDYLAWLEEQRNAANRAKLPQTDGDNTLWAITLGTLFVIAAATLYVSRRKRA